MYVERILTASCNGAEQDVAVRIFSPEKSENCWVCEFEIHWPGNIERKHAYGEDGVQALFLSMMLIGTILYASDLHKQKQLYWLEPGAGFGFPLTGSTRDLAEGMDRSL